MPGIKDTSKSPMDGKWEMNEDIVISGVSGRFAESDNIDELAKNLFDNVDMITEDDRRWPMGESISFCEFLKLFPPKLEHEFNTSLLS